MSFLCQKLGIPDFSDSLLKKTLFYTEDFYDKIMGIVVKEQSSPSAVVEDIFSTSLREGNK